MNKLQLINTISKNSCVSKAVVHKALNVLILSIISSLKNGDCVSLIGFGRFFVRTRSSRIVKNPKTGKLIFVQVSKVPSFRAGKKLRKSVN